MSISMFRVELLAMSGLRQFVAEYSGQFLRRTLVIHALFNALLQEGLQPGVFFDGFVNSGIVATGIGADGDKVSVALVPREHLLELVHHAELTGRHDSRHHTR